MRLREYIIEYNKSSDQEVWLNLKKNCSEIIKFYKKMTPPPIGRMFYRFMKVSIPDYKVFIPPKNREPLSSAPWIQKMVDDALEERFGWRPRSSGVFALSLYPGLFAPPQEISDYGKTYMFFPYDGYEYIWSEKISDLYLIFPYSKLDRHYADIKKTIMSASRNETDFEKNLAEWKIKFEEWMDTYRDTGLENALNVRKGYEVMFKCKKYVLVNPIFENSIIEKIWVD